MGDLKSHAFFAGINFSELHLEKAPIDISNLVNSP